MEHYIKLDNYHFDHVKKLLSFTIYFDIEEEHGAYSLLDFDTISIDTEKTFVCSNEPSHIATTFSVVDTGVVKDETYYKIVDGSGKTSVRREWNITIDLNDLDLNGALAGTQNFINSLLFIYVSLKGDYTVDSLSWIKKQPKYIMFALYDYKSLYELIFNKIAENIDLDCCTCLDICAANNIVFLNALEASLSMERWQDAIKFWNLLHNTATQRVKSCNCK